MMNSTQASLPRKRSTLLLRVGAFFILLTILMAAFAPLLTSHSPLTGNLSERIQGPSAQHILGTDHNGVDVWAQVAYGARLSLGVALSVVFVSTLLGLVLGSLAGFRGGVWDTVIMRLTDVVYSFPGILLVIALVGILQQNSVFNMVLALCLTSWASFARLVRGEVLHLKEKDYVTGAQAVGATRLRVLVRHIWPGVAGPLVVQATFAMAGTIIVESSLSFLGLGPPPNEVSSWGSLLRAGKNYLAEAPHICIAPGVAILILVLGFNLFGDGLRDYLDPKKN